MASVNINESNRVDKNDSGNCNNGNRRTTPNLFYYNAFVPAMDYMHRIPGAYTDCRENVRSDTGKGYKL